MNTEAHLLIPVGDWITLLMHEEAEIQTDEDLVELVQKYSTAQVARMTVASRHLGKSPETILPVDKMLLEHGARAEVAHRVSQAMIKVRVGKREIEVPALIGSIEVFAGGEGDDEQPDGFIPSVSKEAVQRATTYMATRVPGFIRGRLRLLAANKVPLAPVVAELKERIDEIAKELMA